MRIVLLASLHRLPRGREDKVTCTHLRLPRFRGILSHFVDCQYPPLSYTHSIFLSIVLSLSLSRARSLSSPSPLHLTRRPENLRKPEARLAAPKPYTLNTKPCTLYSREACAPLDLDAEPHAAPAPRAPSALAPPGESARSWASLFLNPEPEP